MDTKEIKELDGKFIINTYGERPLALVMGKGSRVRDAEGKEYLDLFSGIGVNLLGYGHPKVVSAIKEQVEKLIHVSNLYYTEPQVKLARLLSENSFGGKCFFSNSGAEANEAAIKLARKYAKGPGIGDRGQGTGDRGQNERYEIITARGSFHGRTLATLSATGQAKYQRGFGPLPAGFKYVPFNDMEAVREAVDDKSCAIMVEPIQGEGGDHLASDEYLTSLRKLSDEQGLLLIYRKVVRLSACRNRAGYHDPGQTSGRRPASGSNAGPGRGSGRLPAGEPCLHFWRKSCSLCCRDSGNGDHFRGEPLKKCRGYR